MMKCEKDLLYEKCLRMSYVIGQQQSIIYSLLDEMKESDRKNDISHEMDGINKSIEKLFYEKDK